MHKQITYEDLGKVMQLLGVENTDSGDRWITAIHVYPTMIQVVEEYPILNKKGEPCIEAYTIQINVVNNEEGSK